MFKRCVLMGTAVFIIVLTAGCGREAPKASQSEVVVQDVIIGPSSSDDPEITIASDPAQSAQQETEALADEKDYLQNEIDALSEKIENLKWLRDSYIQENPSDLDAKLAECDSLIANAQAELADLQDRMARNERDSNAQDAADSMAEDIPQEPVETPLDSPEPPGDIPTES